MAGTRVVAALLAATFAGMPSAALAADGDFRIEDPRIAESSGLALSRAHRHTVWTVNDSGDTARVYAIDTRTGRTVGVHEFGAPVRDTEAIAVGPAGRMFVADIGDNLEDQAYVRVFWFDEPGLGSTSGGWASWELAYPDGPHNAEALLVHPSTGRLFVVTKGRPGAIYRAPEHPSRQGLNRLVRVATAPRLVTDGVFLPGGRLAALRNYARLTVLDAQSWEPVSDSALPLQPQGESIAVADGGKALLVGSEGPRSLVVRVPFALAAPPPAAPRTQPTTTQTPPSSPPTTRAPTSPAAPTTSPTATVTTPSAAATGWASPPASEDSFLSSRAVWTALAWVAGAVVALGVAAVVWTRRPR